MPFVHLERLDEGIQFVENGGVVDVEILLLREAFVDDDMYPTIFLGTDSVFLSGMPDHRVVVVVTKVSQAFFFHFLWVLCDAGCEATHQHQ